MKHTAKLLLLFMICGWSNHKRALTITLTTEEPSRELEQSFEDSDHENKYTIQIDDWESMKKKQLFLILETEDPNVVLSILGESSELKKSAHLIDITSHSGNIMFVLDSTLYNGHLNFFKETKQLTFQIREMTGENKKYKIKLMISSQAVLLAGKSYSARVDSNMTSVLTQFSYQGYQKHQKVRFQAQVLKADEGFQLSATVSDPNKSLFILNEVFKKTVGGLIDNDAYPICQKELCEYQMSLTLKKVKTFIIECQVSEPIEQITYLHYGPYYERKFKSQEKTTYFLPYDSIVSELDITITLTPVIGKSGLYVHAQSLPQSLEKYQWQEVGNLAKRITIRHQELIQMQADKSNLFITVYTEEPGEYLMNVVAHEENLKGVLDHGVIEGGFIKAEEITNYLYLFEVFKTQEISFSVTMNIMTGHANLYLKLCKGLDDCEITSSNKSSSEVISLENEQEKKVLKHNFQCQHNSKFPSTVCYFVIGVIGKENNGTHYDISLHEDNKHRLITPGHLIKSHLGPTEIEYFKFSYPQKKSEDSKLILSVEAVWGNFSVFLSKSQELPTAKSNDLSRIFQSTKSGLYSSMQEIVLNDELIGDDGTEGVFYVGVESLTSCQVNLKFYELDQKTFTFHVLRSGEQQRGTIHKGQEMVYFNIKASLTQEQASTVTINLTPIRGSFEIFTARDGKFPTQTLYDLRSKNNILELNYDEYKNKEEYIIGVAALNGNAVADDLQFVISFNYSNKPIRLKPGILSNFYIKSQNFFIIEITKEMAELLVLQSYRDSSQNFCAFFNGLENFSNTQNQCQFDSKNSISMFFKQDQVKEQCSKFPDNSCFLILKIEGQIDHKFSLGYTYNDKPFKIVKETVIQGPWITQGNHKINFIQHLDLSSDETLFFNSKGLDMNVYTKLIDGDKIGEELILPFPSNLNHDESQRKVNGNVTTVFYSKDKIKEFGKNPELLISVRPNPTADISDTIFDGNYQFSMHSGSDSIPLTKSKTVTVDLKQEEVQYFNFYNHGAHDFFTISVTSDSNSYITGYISKNLNQTPPYTPFLISHSGFGSLNLMVRKEDLQGSLSQGNSSMKGYFTVGIKSKDDVNISVFWNNTPDNDIFELTPGHPTTVSSSKFRKQFFSFMARDLDQPNSAADRGKVRIYINSEVKCNIYLQTNQSMSESKLDTMKEDYEWKSSIGVEGGVHLIEIQPNDSNYCVNCIYFGYIETTEAGQIQILPSIEHLNQPVNLMNGITYPEVLRKKEKKVYRYLNADVDQFSLSFAVLSGYIQIFIHTTEDVGSKVHTEEFRFGNEQKYGYIIVKPSKYKVTKEQAFFFSVEQEGDQKASFNMSLIKSNLKMPINLGVTKQIGVGMMESAEFFFQNQEASKTYNLDIEIVKMDDVKLFQQAKLHLSEFVEVYQDLKNRGKVSIPLNYQAHDEGRLRLTFDLENSSLANYYTIQLYNQIDTFIQLNVILTENQFKLLHLDENSVELVKKDKPRIFEVIGQTQDFLYFDLKQCMGSTNVSFYEGDYDNIQNQEKANSKKLIEKNSFIHYLKPTYERVFIKVEIPEDSPQSEALVNINAFSEKHLDTNPYTEISFKNYDSGNLKLDTEHSQISFDPIKIKSTYSSGFKHRIEYIVFMTESQEARSFLKSCQTFYYEKYFPDQKYIQYVYSVDFSSIEELNKNAVQRIVINLEGLLPNKKYFGVVLAKVSLFIPDQRQVKPVKFGVNYYEEFTMLSPRYSFPFIYAISVICILGLLYVIFNVINDFVFGRIGDYEIMNKLSEFKKLDNNVFGFNTEEILEDEYYELKKKKREAQVSVEHSEEDENEEQEGEFELTDRNVPLEMNL